MKLLVLLLGLEKRRQVVRDYRRTGGLFEGVQQRVYRVGFGRCAGVLRRARRDGVGGESREVRVLVVQTEGFLKTLLKPLEEEQRAAEEQHIALDLASLCQTGDGLVDDRLENRSRNVFLACALVEQRLDIRLREYAAAACDGVDAFRALREPVELGRGDVEQHGHLVDERAGTARARAVHALLQLTGQKDNLRVLAAQLDDNVSRRNVRADRLAGRKDLLHEVDVGGFRNAETGRAGDRAVKRRVLADELARRTDQLDRLFAHLGEVALIVFVDDLSIAHDYDFYRRRADVDANIYIHILIVLP